MLANGFTVTQLAELVRAGLAQASLESEGRLMGIDGTYGFVYCGNRGLGIGVFSINVRIPTIPARDSNLKAATIPIEGGQCWPVGTFMGSQRW